MEGFAYTSPAYVAMSMGSGLDGPRYEGSLVHTRGADCGEFARGDGGGGGLNGGRRGIGISPLLLAVADSAKLAAVV